MRLPRAGQSSIGWAMAMAAVLCFGGSGTRAEAQISLSTAVNLALQNSPSVKVAQADLNRARAVLSETKDAYVPAVSANAGVGKEVGAPLNPPVVFSIGAESLVFNFSERDYIRAARAGLKSAQLALGAAQTNVSEDTVNTYIALDNAQQRREVELDAFSIATRLISIVQDRYAAGIDPHIELTRAKRTAAQIHLQELQAEDEVASNEEHLASLTGIPAHGWKTVRDSIPPMRLPPVPAASAPENPNQFSGVSAAFAAAQAKEYTAHGEMRTLLRPQLSFSANYSRLSDAFSSYDLYYPGFAGTPQHPNSFNSLNAGIQLTLPLLDMVRRAKAREAQADAAHSLFEAQVQQAAFIEGRERLRHSAVELAARADLASLDHDLAQDELDAVLIRLRAVNGTAGGPQSNPKDAENARLGERQRTIDMLNAELQLHQAEVSLMRQEGSLSNYLSATIPSATAAPASVTPDIAPILPPTTGTPPGQAAPSGTAPAPVPTTGTTPSTLPGAPVSTPAPSIPTPSAPGTPSAAPPTTPHP